jgi:hypothetical protein
MKSCRLICATAFLMTVLVASTAAQDGRWPNLAGTPPKLLLLVYQQYRLDKNGRTQQTASWHFESLRSAGRPEYVD